MKTLKQLQKQDKFITVTTDHQLTHDEIIPYVFGFLFDWQLERWGVVTDITVRNSANKVLFSQSTDRGSLKNYEFGVLYVYFNKEKYPCGVIGTEELLKTLK